MFPDSSNPMECLPDTTGESALRGTGVKTSTSKKYFYYLKSSLKLHDFGLKWSMKKITYALIYPVKTTKSGNIVSKVSSSSIFCKCSARWRQYHAVSLFSFSAGIRRRFLSVGSHSSSSDIGKRLQKYTRLRNHMANYMWPTDRW